VNLGDTTKPLGDGIFGRRFFLVGYLPVYAAALFLLLVIWAGARGWHPPVQHRMDFARAWDKAAGLGLGQALVLLVGVTLAAVLLQPLQLWLLRLLEGNWPVPFHGNWTCAWQRRRMARLAARAELCRAGEFFAGVAAPELSPESVQRAGAAGRRLRQHFPLPPHLMKPTGLGNVLVAMEDTAGRAYGMDAVIMWPRLYTVLGDQVRALVDDRRDTLDAAARMAVIMLLTAVTALLLLCGAGWWLLLALLPLGMSVLSYFGAVQAALAYAEAVQVAFDMHRGELLEALRMPRPGSRPDEENLHRQWGDLWRQGIPLRPGVHYETNLNEHRVVLREKK
jgi:hypothetical protein